MSIGVLAALATAWVGGMTLVQIRLWIAGVARRRRSALDAGSRGAVIGLQLAGLTGDMIRAAALTTVGFLLLFPVAEATLGTWSLSESLSRGFVVSAASAVAGAAAWTIFHSARGARWYFVGGLVVGLFVVVLR